MAEQLTKADLDAMADQARLANAQARRRDVPPPVAPRIVTETTSLRGGRMERPDTGQVSGDAGVMEGEGGGGGGLDYLEEVTGAVNGVPSILMVQTDGNGWTSI